jgi:hypothetical protein
MLDRLMEAARVQYSKAAALQLAYPFGHRGLSRTRGPVLYSVITSIGGNFSEFLPI